MRVVDTHWHPDNGQYAADLDAVIARAREAGVTEMVAIGTGDGPPDVGVAVRLAEQHEGFWATVGVHPTDALKFDDAAAQELERLAQHRKVIAIGEIGLDFYWKTAPHDLQREVFERQIEIARAAGLPIIIHTREAWDATIEVLRAVRWTGGGIFHCFTGDPAQARQALDLGFLLGFGGVLTYPKAQNVRDAAAMAPLDAIVVETDGPYLAPVPYRGKRNEPSFVLDTLRKLAETKGLPVEEAAAATTRNFRKRCLRERNQSL